MLSNIAPPPGPSRKCAGAIALPWNLSSLASSRELSLRIGAWTGVYTSHFAEVQEKWPMNPADTFLSPAYLKSQEPGLPATLRPRYLVLEDENGPFAWMVFQVVHFRALDNIRDPEVWKGLAGRLKRLLAHLGNFRMLLSGNLLFPGEHGWIISGGKEKEKQVFQSLEPLLRQLARKERARVVVCKDFSSSFPFSEAGFFHELDFQPNMILKLRPRWKQFGDYLDAMHSKYRIRARRAFSKAEGLIYKELSLIEVEHMAPELAKLYQEVVAASGFSLVSVGPEYFVALKRSLGRDFRITACFEGDRLVGFYSTLRNGEDLEAHFIGFHAEWNRSHQLYLNMLYRMVGEGIESGARQVIFARTAMEIKSSVGAEARPANVYLAHLNPLLNCLLPWAVRLLEPRESWVPRHPFREGED